MSLQLLAKQMEAKGRGGDSVLVHMTPGEVEGLQKLAESAGGSLSVNPETGLVEANSLKRMLPTLVGIGVGAFAGPLAGAAAGAAVGGYQAKRNDQDVGMGMLMGGLGGYGGGAMGAGLTAAGAGTAAAGTAAAGTAAPLTASQSLAQAGQGITALGADAAKRAAFANSVGMSGVGMAAAPLMAPGKAPGEIPTDDKMYYTEYNPGQTGKRSSTSSEELQFAGGYAPMEEIKADEYMKRRNRQYLAAEGGLMSLAEGGEVADAAPADAGGMTGASKAAFDYLMGKADSSAPQGIAAPAVRSAPVVGADNMYAFDPTTGAFIRNQNYVDPASGTRNAGLIGQLISGGVSGGSDYTDPNPGWTNMSDAEKAAYYAENPTMAGITQFGQNAFNFGTVGQALGRAQDYAAPGFRENQALIAQGIDPMGPQPASQGGGGDSSGWSPSENQNFGGGFDYSGDYDRAAGGSISLAAGGLMGLAKGGMKSGGFVIPADVVSMVGEGNTDAGYSRIKSIIPGATAIKGKDGGQADTVKTSIEGKQPARVAHGEMYIPPETVKRMGGAKKLYAMMDRVREQATGSKKQIKPVSLKQAMA
jgi:hypothetical protein